MRTLAPGTPTHPIVIDTAHNAFILCPDVLLSPSRITGALSCLRRGILSDLVRPDDVMKTALLGTVGLLVHMQLLNTFHGIVRFMISMFRMIALLGCSHVPRAARVCCVLASCLLTR